MIAEILSKSSQSIFCIVYLALVSTLCNAQCIECANLQTSKQSTIQNKKSKSLETDSLTTVVSPAESKNQTIDDSTFSESNLKKIVDCFINIYNEYSKTQEFEDKPIQLAPVSDSCCNTGSPIAYSNKSNDGKSYCILYCFKTLNKLYTLDTLGEFASEQPWALHFVLAHELSHHLLLHTDITTDCSTTFNPAYNICHLREFAADAFALWLLYIYNNKNLNDIKIYSEKTINDLLVRVSAFDESILQGDSKHPSLNERKHRLYNALKQMQSEKERDNLNPGILDRVSNGVNVVDGKKLQAEYVIKKAESLNNIFWHYVRKENSLNPVQLDTTQGIPAELSEISSYQIKDNTLTAKINQYTDIYKSYNKTFEQARSRLLFWTIEPLISTGYTWSSIYRNNQTLHLRAYPYPSKIGVRLQMINPDMKKHVFLPIEVMGSRSVFDIFYSPSQEAVERLTFTSIEFTPRLVYMGYLNFKENAIRNNELRFSIGYPFQWSLAGKYQNFINEGLDQSLKEVRWKKSTGLDAWAYQLLFNHWSRIGRFPSYSIGLSTYRTQLSFNLDNQTFTNGIRMYEATFSLRLWR